MNSVEQLPPQNIEAEQNLLGAMLLKRDAIIDGIDIIKPQSFYKEIHSIIYSTILEIFNNGVPVDLVTVHEYLKNNNKLEEIGGVEYLSYLAESTITTANARKYAEIIREKEEQRKLRRILQESIPGIDPPKTIE